MPNEEHLRILERGVKAWNRWRGKNPHLTPALERAHLDSAMLAGADFHDAVLRGASLEVANLSGASLFGANLSGAKLNGANLTGADLRVAECRYAELAGADLRGAHCAYANFSGANLKGANLESVTLDSTIFGDSNLSQVRGLETCRHARPSVLDHQTLAKSGTLPINFLRGCGLPDILIDYIPSLLYNPVEFYSCFISYSSKDQMFADRLYADLQNKGVRCWLATKDLKTGEKFRVTIDETIRVYEKLLLVLSEHSISSHWVEKEVETAMELERDFSRVVLFPVRLDDAVMGIKSGWPADVRRTRHIGDFREWEKPEAYQKVFGRLLRDLKAEAKKA